MSRTIPNSGVNYLEFATADRIMSRLSGASAYSFHACIKVNSAATNDYVFFGGLGSNTTGLAVRLSGAAPHNLSIAARSQGVDTLQTQVGTSAGISNATWVSIGGVVDIAGDTITPYVAGVADGGGSVTFGASTLTPGTISGSTDSIGNGNTKSSANALPCDISCVAFWSDNIGADSFAALAAGYHPSLIRLDALQAVFLDGDELVDRWSGLTVSVVGTVNSADDPPIIYPSGVIRVAQSAAAAAGNRRRRVLICGRAA